MSEPTTNPPDSPAAPFVHRDRLKVLVADDSPEFLVAASEFLKTNPLLETVGMALNGEDAVRLAHKLAPDLVLVDYRMTEMNGAETAEELKRMHPAPRVVVVSGHDDPAYRTRSHRAGADAYLLKTDFLECLDPLVEKLFFTADSHRQVVFSESLRERTRRLNRDATVVLIDDDFVTQELVHFLLTNAGYQVHKAGTGKAGLELVREHRPDLVLLDVGLPDISGIEVCKAIKADPRLRNTLVMHLSATHTSEDDMARGLEGGADAYFTLPFQKEQLLARVDSLVRIARLETALSSNDSFFENLFRKSTLGVAYAAPHGRLLSINEPLRELLGLENWQISGRGLADFATIETRPAIERAIEQLQTGKVGAHRGDARIACADGRKIWARLTLFPQHDAAGKLSNLIALVEDITPQKHASDIRNAMLESIPASIAMLDRHARIIASNQAWSEQFASLELSGRATTTGGDFLDYCATVDPAARARLENGLRSVLRGDTDKFQLDYHGGTVTRPRRFRLLANPVVDDLVGAALVTHMDITEQYQLEQQFRQSQKMDALGQLAGGVAHDFSNLLMVIRCNIDVITRPDLQPRTRANCLKDIQAAATLAGDLSRQLLAFSRQQPMEMVELDLARAVANLLRLLTRTLGEAIDIRCDIPDNLPTTIGDPGMIDQILINLALNARDAMREGGALSVALNLIEREPPAGQNAAATDRWIELSVRDTGTGIASELHEKVFEPFFTTKEPGKGTGLGLATVHGIVKQHRGWIDIDSAPGAGTRLSVFLPVIETSPDDVAPAPPANLTGNGRGVLVIEDDADVLNGISKMMKAAGFQVWQAETAAAARTIWGQHADEISLVIADIVLPRATSGEDLIQAFRADRPDLRVLLTSGYQAQPTRVVRDAITRFLLKPFSLDELSAEINHCLDEH